MGHYESIFGLSLLAYGKKWRNRAARDDSNMAHCRVSHLQNVQSTNQKPRRGRVGLDNLCSKPPEFRPLTYNHLT